MNNTATIAQFPSERIFRPKCDRKHQLVDSTKSLSNLVDEEELSFRRYMRALDRMIESDPYPEDVWDYQEI